MRTCLSTPFLVTICFPLIEMPTAAGCGVHARRPSRRRQGSCRSRSCSRHAPGPRPLCGTQRRARRGWQHRSSRGRGTWVSGCTGWAPAPPACLLCGVRARSKADCAGGAGHLSAQGPGHRPLRPPHARAGWWVLASDVCTSQPTVIPCSLYQQVTSAHACPACCALSSPCRASQGLSRLTPSSYSHMLISWCLAHHVPLQATPTLACSPPPRPSSALRSHAWLSCSRPTLGELLTRRQAAGQAEGQWLLKSGGVYSPKASFFCWQAGNQRWTVRALGHVGGTGIMTTKWALMYHSVCH